MTSFLKSKGLRLGMAVLVPVLFLVLISWASSQNDTGQKVFEHKCKMCHGKEANGDTKAGKMTKTPDLTKPESWEKGTSLKEVEKVIMEGSKRMPKFKGKLSKEEIAAVAHYIRDLTGVDKQKK